MSKFTPEARGALLERTAAGVPLADACRAVGLREATVKGWLTRGRREGSGEYAAFVEALEEARVEVRSRPAPMDEEELARVVSTAARAGSVQAMKLRWLMLARGRLAPGEEDTADGDDPLAEVDELARRRLGRG